VSSLERPVWIDGMNLCTDHFIMEEQYQARTTDLVMACSLPQDNWGVIDLEINKHSLELGIFKLDGIAGRFARLGFFDYSSASDVRQIELKLSGASQYVYVHCICTSTDLTTTKNSNGYLYRANNTKTADSMCIESRVLDIQLSCEQYLDRSLGSIKLARLDRTVNAGYILQDYHPPCLSVHKASKILEFRAGLIIAIDQLLIAASGTLQVLERHILLSQKNNLLFLDLAAHPKVFWQCFMRNYFELCSVFAINKSKQLPLEYEHISCYEIIKQVYKSTISLLLDCRVQEVVCPKTQSCEDIYTADLSSWRSESGNLYLRLHDSFLAENPLSVCKVLPEFRIIEAIRYSLPALMLKFINAISGVNYFEIIFDDTIKEELMQHDLCIYSPNMNAVVEHCDIVIRRDRLCVKS
jgi:predicted component of type VI protein secretion system